MQAAPAVGSEVVQAPLGKGAKGGSEIIVLIIIRRDVDDLATSW